MTSSTGAVVSGLTSSKYAGFSAAPEQNVGATVAAPADTINLTMRGKINYLTRPGTYAGTVTYTLTPSS